MRIQMAQGSATEDLQDLIEHPRETLAVEIKSHLDLKDGVHQANLARHICALANYGGGYIVFGFDNDLSPVGLPADLAAHYHRDMVSSIIASYLSPAFLCDVVYVPTASGLAHPVIRVPSHGDVPVCARKNGPHDKKGRPQGIVGFLVYIRTVGPNGPESVAISRPDDWAKIIRRCVLADPTALMV
jgi:predicted HTH transcriptional regulator